MAPKTEPPKRTVLARCGSTVLSWLVSLTIIFLCVGSPPPGINESHYLPKAKRVWDPAFASGDDIFLNSNDSHFLASMIAGNLAKHFELIEVAWIGRVACWLLLAVAWRRLANAVGLPSIVQPLVLIAWIFLVRYAHWAGEWFVGGFEAKSIAYPLALFCFAELIEDRWSRAWIILGAAIAFHPVVGGWIAISIAPIWLAKQNYQQRLKQQSIALVIAAAIGLVGVWPALQGFGSPDRDGPVSAARVHAYFRLAHHMCPRFFDLERWCAAAVVLTGFVLLVRSWYRRALASDQKSQGLAKRFQHLTTDPMGCMIALAFGSILISLTGWLIDSICFITGYHSLSAKILRFYWFRWSDVAVPMVTAMLVGWWLTRLSFKHGGKSLGEVSRAGNFVLSAAILIAGCAGYVHWRTETQQLISPADRWLLETPGPFPVQLQSDTNDDLPPRYRDWLAACQWIKENTPKDSLWLTPKHQQSFKWYAQRAEVVSWKDVPQDNASIIEWYRRLDKSDDPAIISCAPPRTTDGKFRGWKTEELVALAQKYKFNWILIDRTYQDSPPLLECKYPIDIDNRSFAVFYVPTR